MEEMDNQNTFYLALTLHHCQNYSYYAANGVVRMRESNRFVGGASNVAHLTCHGWAVDAERPDKGHRYPCSLGRALSWLRRPHAPGMYVCYYVPCNCPKYYISQFEGDDHGGLLVRLFYPAQLNYSQPPNLPSTYTLWTPHKR